MQDIASSSSKATACRAMADTTVELKWAIIGQNQY